MQNFVLSFASLDFRKFCSKLIGHFFAHLHRLKRMGLYSIYLPHWWDGHQFDLSLIFNRLNILFPAKHLDQKQNRQQKHNFAWHGCAFCFNACFWIHLVYFQPFDFHVRLLRCKVFSRSWSHYACCHWLQYYHINVQWRHDEVSWLRWSMSFAWSRIRTSCRPVDFQFFWQRAWFRVHDVCFWRDQLIRELSRIFYAAK